MHHLNNDYLVNQRKYTLDSIRLANLIDRRIVETPLEINLNYSKNDGAALADPTLYLKLVGSLRYPTISRPDIAYAVRVVS